MSRFFNPNDFPGSDSERINAAVRAAAAVRGTAVVTSREDGGADGRRHWLLDSAILLPEGADVVVENCKIKLSDRCRDNFFRSDNCGVGRPWPRELSSIHLRGEGAAVLEGADRPRATGDGGKRLGERTYGTDAGAEGECGRGDWRNIGVLLVRVRDFSLTGLTIRDSHSWAVSLERCGHGLVRDMTFRSRGRIEVDGREERVCNQDGLDLRAGCHDILVEAIRGETGDDLLALTALDGEPHEPGAVGYSQVTAGFEDIRDADIRFVTIRDVMGYCASDGQIVRFLNSGGIRIRDVTLDGLVDTSPDGFHCPCAIRIGDDNPAYGGIAAPGDTSGLVIRSVISNARQGVLVIGSLVDSVICDVVSRNPGAPPVCYYADSEPGRVRNVSVSNLVAVSR